MFILDSACVTSASKRTKTRARFYAPVLDCFIRTTGGEKKMGTCENLGTMVVIGKNASTKEALVFCPRCKLWSCDYCAELNKDYWIHQATRGSILLVAEGATLQFITLTSRPYATPASSLYFFSQNWPKLRKRASDQTKAWEPFTGIKWSYFLVPERHKTGVLHVHLIAATHLEGAKWWHDNAYKSGFGYQTKVEPIIDPAGASHYISKYLHKGAGKEDWPKGFRRVRHSQNWPVTKEKPLEGWDWITVGEGQVWQEKEALIDMGFNVRDNRNIK